MGLSARDLTVWVGLGILAGVGLGWWVPVDAALFQRPAHARLASVAAATHAPIG